MNPQIIEALLRQENKPKTVKEVQEEKELTEYHYWLAWNYDIYLRNLN